MVDGLSVLIQTPRGDEGALRSHSDSSANNAAAPRTRYEFLFGSNVSLVRAPRIVRVARKKRSQFTLVWRKEGETKKKEKVRAIQEFGSPPTGQLTGLCQNPSKRDLKVTF